MLPPRVDNKEKTVSFRLEDTERQELELMKEQHGYKSLSKYLRDSIFNKRIPVVKIPFSVTRIQAGILQYAKQLNRIGSNYNQNVRRIHTLSEMKRKNGDPVIHTTHLLRIEEQNKALMEKIQKTQDNLLSFVDESLQHIESRIAAVFSTSADLKSRFIEVLEVPIHNETSDPVSLKQYIKTHEDAYAAFTALLETILKIEDYSMEFDNNE